MKDVMIIDTAFEEGTSFDLENVDLQHCMANNRTPAVTIEAKIGHLDGAHEVIGCILINNTGTVNAGTHSGPFGEYGCRVLP